MASLIAYSGYDSTDATWKDASIYVMDADGKNAHVLTDKFDRAPQGMIWAERQPRPLLHGGKRRRTQFVLHIAQG